MTSVESEAFSASSTSSKADWDRAIVWFSFESSLAGSYEASHGGSSTFRNQTGSYTTTGDVTKRHLADNAGPAARPRGVSRSHGAIGGDVTQVLRPTIRPTLPMCGHVRAGGVTLGACIHTAFSDFTARWSGLREPRAGDERDRPSRPRSGEFVGQVVGFRSYESTGQRMVDKAAAGHAAIGNRIGRGARETWVVAPEFHPLARPAVDRRQR